MRSLRVMHIVGARPNFMKAAAVIRAMAARRGVFRQALVHTGQHYDDAMAGGFFRELNLPRPAACLGIGSGSHAGQTARVMEALEPVLGRHRPDWVMVYGDVNSTLAAALVCAKSGIKLAHVEAGLRSFDRTMPEEVNRVVTDRVSDLLFTPSADADANLRSEGIPAKSIRRVGNVMIDTLVRLLPAAERRWTRWNREFRDGGYVLVTLHRPSNVDDPATLSAILAALGRLGRRTEVLFPVHPRTGARLRKMDYRPERGSGGGIQLLPPLGYLDFLALEAHAAAVVTDSGGVQEETTYLGIPCLTVRPNTERPVTIEKGTNRLVGDPSRLGGMVVRAMAIGGKRVRCRIPLWDGRAGHRVAVCMEG